jgi:hypothetical protein
MWHVDTDSDSDSRQQQQPPAPAPVVAQIIENNTKSSLLYSVLYVLIVLCIVLCIMYFRSLTASAMLPLPIVSLVAFRLWHPRSRPLCVCRVFPCVVCAHTHMCLRIMCHTCAHFMVPWHMHMAAFRWRVLTRTQISNIVLVLVLSLSRFSCAWVLPKSVEEREAQRAPGRRRLCLCICGVV